MKWFLLFELIAEGNNGLMWNVKNMFYVFLILGRNSNGI